MHLGLVLGDVWYINRQGETQRFFVDMFYLRNLTCAHCLKSTFCEVWVSGEPFPKHPGDYVLTRCFLGCLVYDSCAGRYLTRCLGGSFLDDLEDWKFTWPLDPWPQDGCQKMTRCDRCGLFVAENMDLKDVTPAFLLPSFVESESCFRCPVASQRCPVDSV